MVPVVARSFLNDVPVADPTRRPPFATWFQPCVSPDQLTSTVLGATGEVAADSKGDLPDGARASWPARSSISVLAPIYGLVTSRTVDT